MVDTGPPKLIFKIAIWLTSVLDWLRDLITPAPIRVLEKGLVFIQNIVIFACCKLDIPDAIPTTGWTSASSVASKTKLPEEVVARLLKAAHQYGFFRLKGNTTRFQVSHNRLSRVLVGSEPGTMKPMLLHQYLESLPGFVKLHEVAKTALDDSAPSAFAMVHGAEFFPFLDKHPERLANFSQAMVSLDALGMGTLLTDHNWAQYSRVLDIGGATGSFLGLVVDATKKKGVVCDLKPVVKDAIKVWDDRKAAGDPLAKTALPNLSFEPIDFLQKGNMPAAKDGDCYLFRVIYHDWSDEKVLQIMRNTRYAMGSAKATMVIIEASPTGLSRNSVRETQNEIDVLMMVLLKGKERTKPQWEMLFSQTGFRLDSYTETRGLFTIWVAKPIA